MCGGCLAGTTFSGDYDGTRPAGYYDYDINQSTSIQVEVTSKCDADDCSTSADIEALYNSIWNQFAAFLTGGDLEEGIHSVALNNSPPVAELFGVVMDTTSLVTDGAFKNPLSSSEDTVETVVVTTTGALSVPNLNQEVEAVQTTVTGQFDVNNFDTSSFNVTEVDEASEYFAMAIEKSLESVLSPGSTVTVTSIADGVVQYEIVTYTDSNSEATTAVNNIQSTISSSMNSITDSVVASSQLSSNPDIVGAMANTTIASHTPSPTPTLTTISKMTAEGEFTVDNFTPSSFNGDTTKIAEATDYFESAITQELEAQSLLPEGAHIVVTGLSDGSVEYEIVYLGEQTSAEASASITSISSALSNATTLESISSTVKTESADSSISSDLQSVAITDSTQTGTTGLTMTAAEEEEAKVLYTEAIKSSLGTDLPEGSTVIVTSIANGVVSYEITMDIGSSGVASSAVDSIKTSLATTSTLEAITTSVETAALGSSIPVLVNAMVGADVASNTAGITTESTVRDFAISLVAGLCMSV